VGLGVVSSRDIDCVVTFRAKWFELKVGRTWHYSQSAGTWEVYKIENDPLSSAPALFSCVPPNIDTCIDQITRSSRRPYHVRPSSHPVDAPSVSLGSIVDFDPGPDHHQFYPYRRLFCSRFPTRSNVPANSAQPTTLTVSTTLVSFVATSSTSDVPVATATPAVPTGEEEGDVVPYAPEPPTQCESGFRFTVTYSLAFLSLFPLERYTVQVAVCM
jgi:hypothetical protein